MIKNKAHEDRIVQDAIAHAREANKTRNARRNDTYWIDPREFAARELKQARAAEYLWREDLADVHGRP